MDDYSLLSLQDLENNPTARVPVCLCDKRCEEYLRKFLELPYGIPDGRSTLTDKCGTLSLVASAQFRSLILG